MIQLTQLSAGIYVPWLRTEFESCSERNSAGDESPRARKNRLIFISEWCVPRLWHWVKPVLGAQKDMDGKPNLGTQDVVGCTSSRKGSKIQARDFILMARKYGPTGFDQ